MSELRFEMNHDNVELVTAPDGLSAAHIEGLEGANALSKRTI